MIVKESNDYTNGFIIFGSVFFVVLLLLIFAIYVHRKKKGSTVTRLDTMIPTEVETLGDRVHLPRNGKLRSWGIGDGNWRIV